jgi:integrase
MGKKRKVNKHLPERVYVDRGKQRKDGSWPTPKYYYKPPKGKQIILGNTEAQMHRKKADLIETRKKIITLGDWIDKFVKEVVSKKEGESYANELIKAKFLKAYFDRMLPDEVTPQDIYEYMDIRSHKQKHKYEINGKKQTVIRGGKVAANNDRSFLSRVYSFIIRKGGTKHNPCKDVERFEENHRDRYPEDWELKAVYNEGSEILKCILDFAYLSGQRRSDIIHIKKEHIDEEGIRIVQAKSKNNKVVVKLLLTWTDALKACVDKALQLRSNVYTEYLFCKEDGTSYKKEGVKSMYERAMQKAIAKGTIKEKFNFHDLRAKTYSDDDDEQQRIKRAGHVDGSMSRVYDRKFKKVKPLK